MASRRKGKITKILFNLQPLASPKYIRQNKSPSISEVFRSTKATNSSGLEALFLVDKNTQV